MLGFCAKYNIVRIGGRSKEPELEECNLKNIQNSIRYDKATLTEIENTKSEIYQMESKIKKITKKVEDSSYLTNTSLVDELREEQIRSLILKADQLTTTRIYRVDRGNTGKRRWKEQLLDDVSKEYGSVKEFLQMAMQIKVSDESHVGIACKEVFDSALKHWFPGRRELKRMKDFQTEFILQIQSDKTTEEDASKGCNDDDDSGDEDHVRQVLETRMAAGTRHEAKSDSLIIFDRAKTKNGRGVLISISDYPPDIVVNSQILSVNNLWSLNDVQRLQFLYCILNKKTASVSQELNDLVKKLQSLKSRKEELEITDKVKFLLQKKIIGVTITGASINHDLLHHIGPSVVIVEEAAEILEPSLLAALTPSIEHLILIGDHKQLRPQVDTYELCKNFQFDVSMMERLIGSGFPFRCLARQNRMRPEFSALLKDIYPNLQDNLRLVSEHEPLKCIAKSMFFWSHDDPETKDRTYTNVKEADRVIALVKYLLSNGVCPSDITVLSAYLGQTRYLRKLVKQAKDKSPSLFEEGFVQVQTIDNYQGDENKYVIISLVRSNKENNIGFLKEKNRRCVAQSRAKCGMYFVGNRNTFLKGSCWSGFISSMKEQGCVGDKIPLRCTKHEISNYKATDCNDILNILDNPTLLCNQPCGAHYKNCEKHRCRNPCRSHKQHDHNYCPELVDDQFPDCGHYVKRKCPRDIFYLSCQYTENVDLPCGHQAAKKCSQDVSYIQCRKRVTATFPRCGHKTQKLCHEKIEIMSCEAPCKEMMSCGKHRCKAICGRTHGHDICSAKTDYKFPDCDHPSPTKKRCSEKITWPCRYKVTFIGDCCHEIQRECFQSESEVKCLVPCKKLRKCEHPCTNACGDDCEKGECKHCQAVYKKKMKEFREAARKRVKELREKIKKKDIRKFSQDELHSTGSTAAEYRKVKNQVLKFIKPCHQWFPTITKIEKVTNLELEKKFEAAKSKAFGDYIDTKFHGTSNQDVKEIIRKGFKRPEANPSPPKTLGMYGQGIYFATDSSKSARGFNSEGSQKLLLCQVILGKSMTVEKEDNTLNRKTLRDNECDSVYAPRGTEEINDEFVIFDPDQALPQYIIHFSSTKNLVPPSPTSLTTLPYFKKNMTASRSVNFQDPYEMYYNFAESHFRRMAASSKPPLPQSKATISSIDIVINKDLEDKFKATKKMFKSQGIPDKEILAYHGTDPNNIDSILKSNLQLSYAKRQAYGKGNYFSEFPAVSLGYGQGLLLCRILPGKEYVDSTNCDIPQEYNSKKVLKSQLTGVSAANASGDMIIIENSDQILPFFVIHR